MAGWNVMYFSCAQGLGHADRSTGAWLGFGGDAGNSAGGRSDTASKRTAVALPANKNCQPVNAR